MAENKQPWWKDTVVTHCPCCFTKMRTIDTRPYHKLGYPSNRRRKYCSHCDYEAQTVEIPIELSMKIEKEIT